MNAIDMQNYLYTWSSDWDWIKVRDEGIYEPTTKNTYGHIFCVFAYTDKFVYGINSYGKDNGIFKISWDIFLNHMPFSKYAIVDNKWEQIYNAYRSTKIAS
jgi:hypothetical protein